MLLLFEFLLSEQFTSEEIENVLIKQNTIPNSLINTQYPQTEEIIIEEFTLMRYPYIKK